MLFMLFFIFQVFYVLCHYIQKQLNVIQSILSLTLTKLLGRIIALYTEYLYFLRVSGRLSWLSIRLRLRSWSCDSWVRALRWALCWQLSVWIPLQVLGLPLTLSLPHLYSVLLSLSQKKRIQFFFTVYIFSPLICYSVPCHHVSATLCHPFVHKSHQ